MIAMLAFPQHAIFRAVSSAVHPPPVSRRFMQNKLVSSVFIALAAIAVVPAAQAGRMCPDSIGPDPGRASSNSVLVKYRTETPVQGRGLQVFDLTSTRGDVMQRVRTLHPALLQATRQTAVGADVVRISAGARQAELDAIVREFQADPRVAYAGIDHHFSYDGGGPYYAADPLFPQQWDLKNGSGGVAIQNAWWVLTPSGWQPTMGGGAVVAVIDGGITAHPDLDVNVVPGYDFVGADMSRDGDGRDADASDPGDWTMAYNPIYCIYTLRRSTWHGTHVAGTVAAKAGNGIGVFSMAPSAKVMPLRVFGVADDPEGGSSSFALESDVIDAIVWAAGGVVPGVPTNTNPVEVINLSLGMGGSCSAPMQSAINYAISQGTTVVAAAGNGNLDVAGLSPANCQNVIAVAATDINGAKASFSNYGATVDVSAPGVGILSTYNAGNKAPAAANYDTLDGTSMAAPHVAGLVAMLQAFRPRTPAAVEQLIKTSARALPGACAGGCGAGIIDPQAAISLAQP
jgi:serine protease